jgi:hypothetical protein
MDWQTFLSSLAGSAIPVTIAAWLLNSLSNRSIERQKAQQSRELLEMQNAFAVGATSHMATVAFDKHIGFCEEYVEEMYKALYAFDTGWKRGRTAESKKVLTDPSEVGLMVNKRNRK